MIYEGAVIRRLVTPSHPGDPKLDDPNAEIQCRVEYVKSDPAAGPLEWTREIAEAHRYPRHLDADRRAKEISPHCFARVVQRETETDLIATNLPAESSSSGRAPEQLQRVVPKVETRLGDSRAAGKTSSKRPRSKRGRLAAIRLAAERVGNRESAPSDRQWWRQGQYA